MADKNFDDMTDEEFMDVLENIDDIDEPEVDTEDTDHDSEESEDDSTDTETNEEDDDFLDDTKEDDEDEDEDEDGENSQDIEDDSEDDESGSEEDDSKDDDKESENDDEESNADKPDGMTEADKVDYQKAYAEALAEKERYENFYNQVTSEFVANGKVMKGFDDPKKIIQAQQMAAGFSDKMKSFKQYRPFIAPLKEKGIIDDPDKFNLMMNALDGDKEAIKTLIKQAEIDPIELDMENIDYKPTNSVASNIEVAYEDVVDTAQQYGVRDRVEEVISKDWDDKSVLELLDDPQNSADLVSHLSTGVYDLVQERIAEKKMTDPYGAYSSKRAIDQYREAAQELEGEYLQYVQQQEQAAAQDGQYPEKQFQDNGYGNNEVQFSEEEIQAEMERIVQEQEYAQNVEKRNVEADKARKKAASVSRRKPKSRKKESQQFDVATLSDEEFEDLVTSFITEPS